MGQNLELTEKEKEILRLRKLPRTYRQICKELGVNPNEISTAIKKESGKYNPRRFKEEQSNDKPLLPTEDYSKIYLLFSKGWLPKQVAIEMNLPADFVNEHYMLYLEMEGWYLVTQLYKFGGPESFRAVADLVSFLKANRYDLKKVIPIMKYAQEVIREETNLRELRSEHDSLLNQKLGFKSANAELEEENSKLKQENRRLREENNNEVKCAQKIKEWIDANPGITTAQIVEKKIAEALASNYTMMDCTFPAVIQAMRAYPDNAYFLINPDPRDVHPIVHRMPDGFQRYCNGMWKQMKDVAYQYCTQYFADKIRNKMAA